MTIINLETMSLFLEDIFAVKWSLVKEDRLVDKVLFRTHDNVTVTPLEFEVGSKNSDKLREAFGYK